VADESNHRIVRFDPGEDTPTFISRGSLGPGPEQFKCPWSLAVDVAGNVYVADILSIPFTFHFSLPPGVYRVPGNPLYFYNQSATTL